VELVQQQDVIADSRHHPEFFTPVQAGTTIGLDELSQSLYIANMLHGWTAERMAYLEPGVTLTEALVRLDASLAFYSQWRVHDQQRRGTALVMAGMLHQIDPENLGVKVGIDDNDEVNRVVVESSETAEADEPDVDLLESVDRVSIRPQSFYLPAEFAAAARRLLAPRVFKMYVKPSSLRAAVPSVEARGAINAELRALYKNGATAQPPGRRRSRLRASG
jgi:hypothetical protein